MLVRMEDTFVTQQTLHMATQGCLGAQRGVARYRGGRVRERYCVFRALRRAARTCHRANGATADTHPHVSQHRREGEQEGQGAGGGRRREEEESVRRTRADHRAVPLNGDQVAE
jgi:hypothetical protein